MFSMFNLFDFEKHSTGFCFAGESFPQTNDSIHIIFIFFNVYTEWDTVIEPILVIAF